MHYQVFKKINTVMAGF